MKTTSHFIWIELKSEIFSNLFVEMYKYVKEKNIENSILFQNPLSPHITIYYLEKDISNSTKDAIKNDIKNLSINNWIYANGFSYFYNPEWDRFVLYFKSNTSLPLVEYRNKLHEKYNRSDVEDNNFSFSPHITFLKILNSEIFEKHRENIEAILCEEISKIKNIDINWKKISLYAVNSQFKEEIQIKL